MRRKKSCLLMFMLVISLLGAGWLPNIYILPVFAEPDETKSFQVSSGLDDAHQLEDTGEWSTSSTAVYLYSYTSPTVRYHGGTLFQDVTVPPGATILSANLSVYVISTFYDDPNLDIYGHDVADAPTYGSGQNLTDRNRTTATLAWVDTDVGTGWKTLNVTDIVQEIVNRNDWMGGNNMSFLWISRSDQNKYLRLRSYEGDTAQSAKLDIEYSESPSYGTNSLWVWSFDLTEYTWLRTGDYPYLNNDTTNRISTLSSSLNMSWFILEDTTLPDLNNVTDVYLEVEWMTNVVGETTQIIVHNGTNEINFGTYSLPSSYSWTYIDATSILDTISEINATKVKFIDDNTGLGNKIRRMRLRLYYDTETPPEPYKGNVNFIDKEVSSFVANTTGEFRTKWQADYVFDTLSHYIFSWNTTGSMVNDTAVPFPSGQSTAWANISKTLPSANVSVAWKVYVNSSADVWNSTPVYHLWTVSPEPTLFSEMAGYSGLISLNAFEYEGAVTAIYFPFLNSSTRKYYIKAYNRTGEEWTDSFYVADAAVSDGHYEPTAAAFPNGCIALFWGYYSTLNWTMTTQSADTQGNLTSLLSSWTEVRTKGVGDEFDYPYAVTFKGTRLIVFSRKGHSANGNWTYLIHDGSSWGTRTTLVYEQDGSSYMQALYKQGNILAVAGYRKIGTPAGPRHTLLLFTDDNGTTWKHWNGTTLSLPVATTEILVSTQTMGGSIVLDQDNKPTFMTVDDSDWNDVKLLWYNTTIGNMGYWTIADLTNQFNETFLKYRGRSQLYYDFQYGKIGFFASIQENADDLVYGYVKKYVQTNVPYRFQPLDVDTSSEASIAGRVIIDGSGTYESWSRKERYDIIGNPLKESLLTPAPGAGEEILYVDGFEGNYTEWIEIGASPYLDNVTTNGIYSKTDNRMEGDWTLENSTLDQTTTINEAHLYFEANQSSGDDSKFEIYTYNGTNWLKDNEVISPSSVTPTWYRIDVRDRIDSIADVDVFKFYVVYQKVGSPNDEIWIRRAYLNITYPTGWTWGTKFTANATERIQAVKIWASDGVAQVHRVAIYNSTFDLLVQSDGELDIHKPNEWSRILNFNGSVTVTQGEDYWLFVMAQRAEQRIAYRSSSAVVNQTCYLWLNYSEPFPNTISPESYENWTLSIVGVSSQLVMYGTTFAPTASNLGHNTTIAGNIAEISSYWTSVRTLSHYILSTNNTGSWANNTVKTFPQDVTEAWGNDTITLNNTVGVRVEYKFYANNTDGIWGASNIAYLITTPSGFFVDQKTSLSENVQANVGFSKLVASMTNLFSSLARTIGVAFNLDALSNLLSNLARTVSLSFSLDALADLYTGLTRQVALAFGLNELSNLFSSVQTAFGKTFSTADLSELFSSASRTVGLSFQQSQLLQAYWSLQTQVSVAFQTADLSSLFEGLTRQLSLSFTRQDAGNMFTQVQIAFGKGFNLAELTSLYTEVARNIAVNFQTQAVANLVEEAARQASLAFSVSELTNSFSTVLRTSGLELALSTLLNAYSTATKQVSLSFSLAEFTSLYTQLTRSITLTFNLTELANSFSGILRTSGLEYVVSQLLNAHSNITKQIALSFNLADLTNVYTELTRSISLAFTLTDLANLLSQAEKGVLGASFNLSDLANLLTSVSKQISVSLSQSDLAKTYESLRRQVALAFSLSDLANFFGSAKKIVAEFTVNELARLYEELTKQVTRLQIEVATSTYGLAFVALAIALCALVFAMKRREGKPIIYPVE